MGSVLYVLLLLVLFTLLVRAEAKKQRLEQKRDEAMAALERMDRRLAARPTTEESHERHST